ncbi:MAG: transporter permease [Blastococcus sp.]|jgi:ribose transport system permease protein|nr:transporter permease [Blastococcus sp.]
MSHGPSATTAAAPAGSPRARVTAVLLRQDVILLAVFIAMVAFFTAMNPVFFSRFAFANILQDWAPIILLAIGETYVIITAGIDLSVGATLGLSGVSAALTIRSLHESGTGGSTALLIGIAVALLVGLAVGAVNGVLITRVGLAPFIATLATMGAGAGLTLVVTGGVQIAGGPPEVIQLGNTQYLGLLTLPLIVVLVVLVVAWLVLHQTRFGRWTYAIGSNAFAARGSGIGVDRHLIKIYMLSGLLAGLAGVFVYLRLGSGSPTSGQGQELTAIAAAVIGGSSLFGGSGRMSGTVLGALITTAVLSGLILIGVAPNWQQVVIGVLIAVAVAVQQISARRAQKGAGRG